MKNELIELNNEYNLLRNNLNFYECRNINSLDRSEQLKTIMRIEQIKEQMKTIDNRIKNILLLES